MRVFLDANVYFAGLYSPEGASFLALRGLVRGAFEGVGSRLVLREAERNLRRKTNHKTLAAFHRLLRTSRITIVPAPSEVILKTYEPFIHPKDVPVLAAALEAGVDYLVTLDRRHFLTPEVLSAAGKTKTKIVTPGEFLSVFLRTTTPAGRTSSSA